VYLPLCFLLGSFGGQPVGDFWSFLLPLHFLLGSFVTSMSEYYVDITVGSSDEKHDSHVEDGSSSAAESLGGYSVAPRSRFHPSEASRLQRENQLAFVWESPSSEM
jgi:hypothetical protein